MKTKVLLYCTKAKPYLYRNKAHKNSLMCLGRKIDNYYSNVCDYDYLNGKIIAEFESECEEIGLKDQLNVFAYWGFVNREFKEFNELCKNSCLTNEELDEYLIRGEKEPEGPEGYDIHISNLKPFARPLELSEVKHIKKPSCNSCPYQYEIDCEYHKEVECECEIPLTKAPQNMQWVWYKGEKYVLISTRSKWCSLIMNGEKTDEIRRKILKGM